MKPWLWPGIARDLLDVPEPILARPDAPVTIELAIAVSQAGYDFGDLFLQALTIRARRQVDGRDASLLSYIIGALRARVTADAMLPVDEPEIDWTKVRRPRVTPIVERARAE